MDLDRARRFKIFFVAMFLGLIGPVSFLQADPVPLPCKPEDCPPIDPCKINPDRCKDKGGPISQSADQQVEASVASGCTVSHQECEYPCIEYYPNGTDCRKTKKVCRTVCDDFTVDKGGVDDANRSIQQ